MLNSFNYNKQITVLHLLNFNPVIGSDLGSVGSSRSSFCLHVNHLSFQAFNFLVTHELSTLFFLNWSMFVATYAQSTDSGGKICWSA
jgi:hypothetical protein